MSELLLRTAAHQSLDAFVAASTKLLGCSNWEQKQSSNYVEERYFRCHSLGIQVTAAVADDTEYPDWDIWLCLDSQSGTQDTPNSLDGVADCVARVLTLNGYEVIRPLGGGKKGFGAVKYEANEAAGAAPKDRIVTKRIE
jgi:hypothetical protein